MTECPFEPQVSFPSFGEASARDVASRHAQLSVRGRRTLDHFLDLLQSFFNSQPASRVSPFPPAFLFSICEVLQQAGTDAPADEEDEHSVLPSVLSQLREWRLLDPDYRYSSGGVYKLALDLAAIQDEASVASTCSDSLRASGSRGRLRMKWIRSDLPSERQIDQDLQVPPSPSSPCSALDSAHGCAHALFDPDVRSDSRQAPCQANEKLGTPNSEDASAVGSRQRHFSSGFRSGCLACRHPQVLALFTPSPRKRSLKERQRTPFASVNRLDDIVLSPRHPTSSIQRTATKKTTRETPTPSRPRVIAPGPAVDENKPPLSKPNARHGIAPPRTHSPRKSNTTSARGPFPAASSHVSSRTREGDKHMPGHLVASVDLWLDVAHPNRDAASPIDLRLLPLRGQRGPCSSEPVRTGPHGPGSVAGGSSSAGASQSRKGVSLSSRYPPTTASADALPLLSSVRPDAGLFPNPKSAPRPSSISTPRSPSKKTRSESFVGSLPLSARHTPCARR